MLPQMRHPQPYLENSECLKRFDLGFIAISRIYAQI
jgi:hypothetical protein